MEYLEQLVLRKMHINKKADIHDDVYENVNKINGRLFSIAYRNFDENNRVGPLIDMMVKCMKQQLKDVKKVENLLWKVAY